MATGSSVRIVLHKGKGKTTEPEGDSQTVAAAIFHASTLDFFLAVLGLADSVGSGEPGWSVGGQGALSTSGSGSRGIEGLLETPANKRSDEEVCTEKQSSGCKVSHSKMLLLNSVFHE